MKEALEQTELFIRTAAQGGEPAVRIVYGKGRRSPGGRGVLRQVVPHWLEHDGARWVERFERQLDPGGEDGAALVWLRL